MVTFDRRSYSKAQFLARTSFIYGRSKRDEKNGRLRAGRIAFLHYLRVYHDARFDSFLAEHLAGILYYLFRVGAGWRFYSLRGPHQGLLSGSMVLQSPRPQIGDALKFDRAVLLDSAAGDFSEVNLVNFMRSSSSDSEALADHLESHASNPHIDDFASSFSAF